MNIGKKILKLRKEKKLSQEQLADIIGVTRQTISNWELNETTPDTNQLIILSKKFNISIDELIDNNINNIIMEKITNTEKLAGVSMKFIKKLGIFIYLTILIFLITITIYFLNNKDWTNKYQMEFNCVIDNVNYNISTDAEENNYYIIVTENNSSNNGQLNNFEKYLAGSSLNEVVESLNTAKKIIINNGGTCK